MLRSIFSLLTLTVPFGVSFGSTLITPSVAELSKEANWIGRVQIEEQTDVLENGFPFTEIRGKIVELIKGGGEVGQVVRTRLPGGRRGSQTVSILGMPTVRVGAEYVLFLDSTPTSSITALGESFPQLVGWSLYRLTGTSKDSVRYVVRSGESGLLKNTGNGLQLVHEHQNSVRYQDFLTEVYRSID